jgi:hypothetical protein
VRNRHQHHAAVAASGGWLIGDFGPVAMDTRRTSATSRFRSRVRSADANATIERCQTFVWLNRSSLPFTINDSFNPILR